MACAIPATWRSTIPELCRGRACIPSTQRESQYEHYELIRTSHRRSICSMEDGSFVKAHASQKKLRIQFWMCIVNVEVPEELRSAERAMAQILLRRLKLWHEMARKKILKHFVKHLGNGEHILTHTADTSHVIPVRYIWVYMGIYGYLSIYLSIDRSIYLSIHLSSSIIIYHHLSSSIIIYHHLSSSIIIYHHLSSSIHLSIYPSIHPSIHLSIYLYLYLSIYYLSIYLSKSFSRMRSKGSRFTLGVWGLRVCSLDIAFTSATVRNRPQPFARLLYGRAYSKFFRRGHFWRFQMSRCFVSRGRRGTSWHSDVFCNVSKVVLCGRRNTFATFSDALQFSWQAQHFGHVHRHFAWQAQRFRRVVLRVFCKSHRQGCVKWRQGADSVAGVAFCEMCWKLTEASYETSILRWTISMLLRKLVGKRRFWSYKGSKLAEVSHEMLVLLRPRASSRVSGFSVASAVPMGEATKSLLFECFQAGCHVVLRGTLWHSNLFDNVSNMTKLEEFSHEMLALLRPRVSSRVSGFPVASPCLWGKLQNLSFSNVFNQIVMSFCVAGMALCDIPTCLIKCRKWQNWRKSRTKYLFCCAHVSRLESLVFLWPRRVYGGSCKTFPFRRFPSRLSCRFAWQAKYFSVVFTRWVAVFVAGATFWSVVILRGRRSTSDVSRCVLYTPHSTLHPLHFTLRTLHSTLYTLHFTLYTLHSTLYTPHSTLYTLHSTLYTPHSTLHTLHLTLHTPPHSTLTLHTLHSKLHTSHSTLSTPHSTLYTPHSTIYTLHSTLYTWHFTLYTPHFTLHTLHSPHFTLYTPHFTLHTPHCTLHTLHSTLYSLHSALHTLHFTLHSLHSTLHTLHSTLYTPHSTLYTPHPPFFTLHSTLYTPHFTLHTPHFTLDTPHFTLHTLPSRLYTPHSTLSRLRSSIFHSLRCIGMVAGEKCTRLFK